MQKRRPSPSQAPPSTPSAMADGLPQWWSEAKAQNDVGVVHERRGGTDTAAAAQQAATLMRVIVNVRINGKEVKVPSSITTVIRAVKSESKCSQGMLKSLVWRLSCIHLGQNVAQN